MPGSAELPIWAALRGAYDRSVPRESYTLRIEDVFMITGRGVAVSGVHSGGDVRTGDAATVLDGTGVRHVPRLAVEMHAPPGKLCLVLHGVGLDDVSSGSVLEGPRT